MALAGLCRSPVCWIFQIDGESLAPEVRAVGRSVEAGQEAWLSDAFRERAVALCARLVKRRYLFEPYRQGPEGQGLVEPFLLVVSLGRGAFAAVATEHADSDRFNEVVVRSQLLSTLIRRLGVTPAGLDPATGQGAVRILEIIEEVTSQERFKLAAMRFVDEVAYRYGAGRVSLGWMSGQTVKAVAVSGLERFDRSSDAIAEQESMFEECADQERTIALPADSGRSDRVTQAHERAMGMRSLAAVATVPVMDGERFLGALTMEFTEAAPHPSAIDEVRAACDQTAKWLAAQEVRDRNLFRKGFHAVRHHASWWLGPRNTLVKLTAVILLIVTLACALIRINFTLDAPATLEADRVGFLSVPYDGFVETVVADAGDFVNAGDPLITINRDELLLRETAEFANLQRYRREVEKARSDRQLVDMRVAMSRAQQAEVELERIRYYLAQAELKSPLNGVIVEGNRSELEGAPVSKGELLMKVADPAGMFVRVKLSERDIDYVEEGSTGAIRLLTQPERAFPFVVERIIPAAQVDPAEGNVFIVRGRFEGDVGEAWWRPGMSGSVRIDAGKRSVFGVVFHRTWDAVRMWLWI